jgi:hypothetical protein
MVGASENELPNIKDTYGDIWPTKFPKPPVSEFTIAGDPNRVAAFSSRGPPRDSRRIKPDVVAPGTMIYSAGSRHVDWPNVCRRDLQDGTTKVVQAKPLPLSPAVQLYCGRESSRGGRAPLPLTNRARR